MGKKNDDQDETYSIIDEIEDQLREALNKKKQEVERELEERIKREKEEAQKRLEDIDREMIEEREALADFKKTLSDFETNKDELKKQIKEHIDKAIQFQTEIENITGKTLEELRKVRELNQKLEELQQETGEKVSSLKKNLEEKFGIVAEVPESVDLESVGMDEDEINLDRDLAKLKKIKELLSSEEMVEEQEVGLEPAMPEEVSKEEPSSDESAEDAEEEKQEVEPEEATEPEKKEEKEVEETPGEEKDQPNESVSEEEPSSNESAEAVEGEKKESFQDVFEKLESCRKGDCNGNDGDVSYFEYNEKIVLDGECLISTLNNSFEETKKLFLKLSQTESPKDQFFIKQEIIRHQETLRKAMLKSIRMCEQENCSLPDYSLEILNTDVLKNVLEMVSMQNWSNQKDFTTFDNFMKSLKDSFYSRITPPVEYIQSIIDQLELEKK